ncbi:MAG: hypothetical protein WCI93_00345, partial [bacterium]
IIISSYTMYKKPSNQQANLEGYLSERSKLPPVDLLKLKEVKTEFPTGFPLPQDSDITYVSITDSRTTTKYGDSVTFPGRAELHYITKEDSTQIFTTYSSAMKTLGLSVSDILKNNPGQEEIYGSPVKKNESSKDVSLGSPGLIDIVILNMPNGSKNVYLSISR